MHYFRSDEEIAALARGMMHRTLPKSEWTHAAHFATALWVLSRHSSLETLAVLRDAIRAYNEAVGGENTDTAGYHETITQASIRAAENFRAGRADEPLFETANQLMNSPLGKSDWILTYWTKDTLFSRDARKAWVPPDVRPLPF